MKKTFSKMDHECVLSMFQSPARNVLIVWIYLGEGDQNQKRNPQGFSQAFAEWPKT